MGSSWDAVVTQSTKRRCYFDHAATAWPKDPRIAIAMSDYMRDVGVSSGRGVHASSQTAFEVVQTLRRRLAETIHAPSPSCVSFHASGTSALNAGLLGLIRRGDHVITSVAEHNSVLRPLEHLRQTQSIQLDYADVDGDGRLTVESVLRLVRKDTAMVVLTTASNVTGIVTPVTHIASELADHPAIVFCDAAQTFGWLPIDVRQGIDVLATPGHKAGGGPLGTAMLYVAPEIHERIQPNIFGGTGSQSESMSMPTTMPDRLEPGSLNVPALAGWLAGLPNDDDIVQHSSDADELSHLLQQALSKTSAHRFPSGELPIASFWLSDIEATEVAIILSSEFGIEVRAGHHCAAKMIDALGGPPAGVVRVSAGFGTTRDQIQRLAGAINEVTGESPPQDRPLD